MSASHAPRWAVPMLCGGRFVVGGGSLVAPRAVARVFGIDADGAGPAAYVARLFGVRAVAMAAMVLASTPVEQRRQLRVGVVVDLVDAAAALSAGRRGQLRPAAAAAACAAALFEAGLGVRALAGTNPAALGERDQLWPRLRVRGGAGGRK